jgi:hypothetical protein
VCSQENTARAYAGALRYWAAWFHLRYRATLALPVPVPVGLQYIAASGAGVAASEQANHSPYRGGDGGKRPWIRNHSHVIDARNEGDRHVRALPIDQRSEAVRVQELVLAAN